MARERNDNDYSGGASGLSLRQIRNAENSTDPTYWVKRDGGKADKALKDSNKHSRQRGNWS